MSTLFPELWLKRFCQDPQYLAFSSSTQSQYRSQIPKFLAFLQSQGLETMAGLTREHLQQYWLHVYYSRSQSGKALSTGTLRIRLGTVVSFVKFLVRNDYLLLDVSLGLKLPKKSITLPRAVLSEGETLRLLTGAEGDGIFVMRDRAILETLYGTGMRNSELRLLQIPDLDWARHLIRIVQGKGGKDRWVPLGEEAELWLEEYLRRSRPTLARAHSGDTLFLSRTGRPLGISQLGVLVANWARKVGLDKHVTPHCLRHSCATHMMRRGAGLRQLQTLLGHESIGTTQTYTRVELSDLRKTLSRYHPRERSQ